jgi:hypothetical protein
MIPEAAGLSAQAWFFQESNRQQLSAIFPSPWGFNLSWF